MKQIYRKELKYLITEETFLRLKHMLDAVLEQDSYCKNGSYMVRSQYYDSIGDNDLRDNLAGVMEKSKLRVRIYSTEDGVARLEHKCKNGSDGIKYALSLTKEEALLMEQRRYEFLLGREEELAMRLYTKLTGQVYAPKTIVEYERTAYRYPASDVRITFDRNLRGSVNPYGIFEKEPSYVPLLDGGIGVFEIKYNDFFPSALNLLLGTLNAAREAYSKYSVSRFMYL